MALRHLLKAWDSLRPGLAGKRIVVFLDYDGTLVPIAPTPAQARTPARTRNVLRRLAREPGVSVAVVSGRSLKDVRKKVGLDSVTCAGNHGLELRGPGLRFSYPLPKRVSAALLDILRRLNGIRSDIPGIIIENKIYSLSFHYRLVKSADLRRMRERFRKAVSPHVRLGRVVLKSGKKVYEVRPPVSWNKGRIALWFLSRLRKGKSPVLPIYIGDDLTDEDAFRALKGKGITVFVGSPGARRTAAVYYLRSPAEVLKTLKKLTDS